MENDLISKSALIQAGNAREMTAAIITWSELDVKTKVAVLLFAKAFKRLVEEAPTVDAVEVVRCKDCKHICEKPHMIRHCVITGLTPDDDDFCSYGERRADV